MITLHHLNNSRSHRILWLLEELGIEYEMVSHKRNAKTRLRPDSLQAVHPLGKAPVVIDGESMIAESGAVIEYLVDKYGNGKLAPKPGTPDAVKYSEWMHYAEGSAMLPIMLALYLGRLGEAGAPLQPRVQSEIHNHLSYMEAALEKRDYFAGNELTGCDINLAYVIDGGRAAGYLGDYSKLRAYLDRVQTRPAYLRAIEKGGPCELDQFFAA